MKNKTLFLFAVAAILIFAGCSGSNSPGSTDQWTISFNANDGVGSMDSVKVDGGTDYTVPSSTFTRATYAFAHWNTKADDSGVSYSPGAKITAVAADIALYAIWLQNPWIITFDANGGSGTMNTGMVENGHNYTLPSTCDFTRGNYVFSHWDTKADDSGTDYALGAAINNVLGDITLYAIWIDPVIVTLVANDGSGAQTTAEAPHGSNYTIPVCSFTFADHSFQRWIDGTGTTRTPGQVLNNLTSNITLTAVWVENPQIVFSANGGSGTMSSLRVAYGGTYTVPANEFSRNTFVFLHWNTQSNDLGQIYFAGDQISPVTSDVTLYAIWSANPRTVSFASGGGSGSMASQQVAYGSQYTVPACTFTYENHSFAHWVDGSGNARNVGDKITVNADVTLTASWVDDPVVQFYANGGSGSMANVRVVYNGSYVIPACGFTYDNYNFLRWRNEGGATFNPGDSITLTSNLILTAVWAENFKVAFNAGGGSGTMATQYAAGNGAFTVPANDFTRTNYSFRSWQQGATTRNPGDVIVLTADATLTAQWDENPLVAFSANGGSGTMASVRVAYNGNFTVPACDFTRDTYAFTGWNTLAGGTGQAYQAGDVIHNVTAGFTLYAMWSANPRTVSFASGGGSGSMESLQVAYGSSYTIPGCSFSYTNHTFLHWTDGAIVRSAGDVVTVTSNLTLTAVWVENPLVTFYANGGSGSMASVRVGYNTSYEIPANDFTYADYHFTNWRNEGGTNYNPGDRITLTANLVLTAVWAENYRVTFNAGGGSGTMAVQHAAASGSYTIPANGFTRDNYSFQNWTQGATVRNPGEVVTLTADATLTAVWAENPVIAFNSNGGSGTMASVRATYNGDYTVPTNGFSRDTYTFTGWNTQSNGGGLSYQAGDIIHNVTAGLTLYAIWSANPRTIAFASGGGAGSMASQQVSYGSSFTIPACTFTYTNRSFHHWVDGAGTEYAAGATIASVTSSLTLTVVWVDDPIVTFHAGTGGSGSMSSVRAVYNTPYVLPACTFTQENYHFAGWRDEGGTVRNAGASVTLTVNAVMTATWTENYQVTFNADGGSGSMAVQHADANGSYTIPSCTFTRSNYTFRYWLQGATIRYPGDVVTLTANTILTASWGATHVITFDPNQVAGTVPATGTMANLSVVFGVNTTIPASSYVRRTYSFLRWATNADGTGTVYTPGQVIASLDADTTLYAIWSRNTNVIKYMGFDDGQTIEQLFTINFGDETLSIDAPPTARSGNALRRGLTTTHNITTLINGATTYSDFWLMYDFFVQYTNGTGDDFPADSNIPLVLMDDSDNADLQFVGTPLFNYATGETAVHGMPDIRSLTSIESLSDGITGNRHTITPMAGTWHTLKVHVSATATTAGARMYIDGVEQTDPWIVNGAASTAHFDRLQIWYHELGPDSTVFNAPNTVIYLDNIGVYADDPANHPD
jgi:uncharacterized repeat protein (TIGR02543 family)